MPSSSNGERDSLKEEIENLRGEIANLRQQQEAPPRSANQDQDEAEEETAAAAIRRRFHQAAASASRHPWYLLPILIVAAGVFFGAYSLWTYLESYETTPDAEVSGYISPISSKIKGSVIKVLVANGESVKAGQPLVELDPHPYRLALEVAQAKYDAAHAEAEIARHKYGQISSGEASPSSSLLSGTLKKGSRDALPLARGLMAVKVAAEHGARVAVDAAELKLRNTTIRSPVSGIVGECSVNVGQLVQPSERLMAVVQPSPVWVTAKFKETQLRKIHRGDPVTIHVDATGQNYRGYVASIAPATTSEFSLIPSENATGNYVKVVHRLQVQIDFKGGQDLKPLRPGMSVEPTVWSNNG